MAHLFLRPTDVLVFRDGRPFSAGDDHFATGPFPPPPSVVYGAIRRALLESVGADLRATDFGLTGTEAEVLGTTEKPGTLQLRGLSLARTTPRAKTRLWPAPLDLLREKSSVRSVPRITLSAPALLPAGSETNLPEGLLPLAAPPLDGAPVFQTAGGFLSDPCYDDVLSGIPPADHEVIRPDMLFLREPRSHVSLRGETQLAFSGTAEEGKLFAVDFVRLHEDVGLAVEVDGLQGLSIPGTLRLGGEARPARIETFTPRPRPSVQLSGSRLRLVLTTPCPSQAGWRPEALRNQEVEINGTTFAARLVGAAVGRHQTVGGWDAARGRPKPARRAAPAGSVYFLDDVADPAGLIDALDGQSLCPHSTDRAQGFGLVRVGTWTPTD